MSAKEQHVPKGYKQTDVGILPIDWQIKNIGDFATVSSGGTPNRKIADYWGGDVPWVTTTLINGGEISYANEFITPKGLDNSSARMCKAGSILMAMYGQGKTRGKAGVLTINASINQACAAIEVNRKTSKEYLLQTLNYMYEEIRELSNSGGQENLSSGIIKSIKIPLPSKPEQTAIANALSDVDALLTELEKLIAKKQAIKTGTMQHLLTGKTRLPQFAYYAEGEKQGQLKGTKSSKLGEIPVDWDVTSIASLTRNIIDYRGRTPKKLGMDWGGGDIVALSAGNVKKGFIDFDEDCYLGSDALYKKWMKNGDVEKNDIVFTMEAPLGNIALIPDSKRYILSQRTVLLQLNREEYEPTFVYQLMMSNHFQNLLSDSATGSTAQGIKRTRFEQLLLCLPSSKEEQTAIAIILSDMDSEIQTLEQRLEKTRQIKQGMMQELLTGRTRLPFKKES